MLRFSQRVVAEGQVPSAGIAETGRPSPFLEMIAAVTSRTNAGASSGTGMAMSWVALIVSG